MLDDGIGDTLVSGGANRAGEIDHHVIACAGHAGADKGRGPMPKYNGDSTQNRVFLYFCFVEILQDGYWTMVSAACSNSVAVSGAKGTRGVVVLATTWNAVTLHQLGKYSNSCAQFRVDSKAGDGARSCTRGGTRRSYDFSECNLPRSGRR